MCKKLNKTLFNVRRPSVAHKNNQLRMRQFPNRNITSLPYDVNPCFFNKNNIRHPHTLFTCGKCMQCVCVELIDFPKKRGVFVWMFPLCLLLHWKVVNDVIFFLVGTWLLVWYSMNIIVICLFWNWEKINIADY